MALNATLTISTYLQPMRLNNNGAAVLTWGHFATSGRTLSDIILLTRVPSGVTITDWYIRGTSGETASVAKFGIKGGGTETTFGTITFSTGAVVTVRAPSSAFRPIRVSASDTDAQAGIDIYMTISAATWTTSTSFDFGFWYLRDGVVNNG